MENFIYRGYVIELVPKPEQGCTDWEWTSPLDEDNENDGVGLSPSREAAMAAVDFDIKQNWGKRC